MGTTAPTAIWLCLLLAWIWIAAHPGTAQRPTLDVDGAMLPELVGAPWAHHLQPDVNARQQLLPDAINEVPSTRPERLTTLLDSATAIAAEGSGSGQATHSTTESSTAASTVAAGSKGPWTGTSVARTLSAHIETQAPPVAITDGLVAAAAEPSAANPAATAFTALAVPRTGVASAGSVVQGRYVVFFSDSVTTVDHGIER